METIKITATEDTPNVILDNSNKVYEISGRSLPEDVVTFYQPVLQWFEDLKNSPVENLELSIRLEYFNTASSKLILDIMLRLEEIYEAGSPVKIRWYYPSNDTDMKEAGEEYSEIVGIPFELDAY